ncbi:uncharacterized protein LOC132697774 isoform X2 [Cylas formicarius]|uniref:uncharacterized protein LOC132697774 isoform X2 n=1 Tax=Cylas formicarius TaxID=197179 RepID=UPI0029589F22|nr:uncharacterized protein LOC132697774 isoform X2 [Cylas formicarius]
MTRKKNNEQCYRDRGVLSVKIFRIMFEVYTKAFQRQMEDRQELDGAKKLNEELKTRHKRLEDENKELKAKFNRNQIDILTKKNELNMLWTQLQRERKATMELNQRLQISREQIESISNLIDELRPIKERLTFKKNVAECLHDMLVKTKLRLAESEQTLQELHEQLTDLEYDVEKTRALHHKRVGQWQAEFLEARIREADVILEFDKLKRDVATVKHELEEKRLIREAKQSTVGTTTSVKINSKGKKYERIIEQRERSIANTVELQNEIDHLRILARKLADQKEDCERRMRSNEETKLQLHEVRRSKWQREYETNQSVEMLREKYARLAEKMATESERVRASIEEKDLAIGEIEEKLRQLQTRVSSEEGVHKNDPDLDTIQELEDRKSVLEQEISELKKT